MEEKLMQEAADLVAQHGTITRAAQASGIPRKTLEGRLRANKITTKPSKERTIEQDVKLSKAKDESKDLRRKYQELLDRIGQQDRAMASLLEADELLANRLPGIWRVPDDKKGSTSTAVAVFSDLHYEETVDPCTINGLNEYNTKIAAKRARAFFTNVIKLSELCRSKSTIDTLVLAILGDLINGHIHEEFIAINSMSPTEAILGCIDLVCKGLDTLVASGGFKQIVVPTSYGNHGRTTLYRPVSTGARNSYEWMMYKMLEKRYADHPVIKFVVSDGYFNMVNVYNMTIRFHHGDNVRYQGGVGGITIPLNKAIAQWNKARVANLDVIGHYHQRLSAKNYVCNGSLCGYGAFAQSIKAEFEHPQQAFFLLHPRYGKTVEAPIMLDETKS
jgi:hypothetical protein